MRGFVFAERVSDKVILTLGARGSLIAGDGSAELIPPFAVTPKDTTGAGDAFIGSFSVFLAEGLPEKEALLRANLYAGLIDDPRRHAKIISEA